MPGDAVALAFLERLAADRRRGAALPLAAYQALFPGFERAVADAYAYAMSLPCRIPDDRSPATLPPAPRGVIDRIGPYHLLDELGRGGQGIVYRARDTRVDRLVALKVLSGIGLESDDALRRFQREATIASKLTHANICTVYEADTDDGVPYIAMEVVEGMSLARLIAASRAEETSERPSWIQLSTEREPAPARHPESTSGTPGSPGRQELMAIVGLMEKTARALHYAHESGIIHRDLKPGNIMVTSAGEPLLMDFGLARLEASNLPTLTATGDLLGTPAYMSPEQISGQRIPLDRRSDVYSLGVALYESLTLQRPFDAPTREGLRQQGRAHEAVTAINEAIRLEPDNPTFHHDLAVTLAQQKRLDAASIEFREAIRLDSEHADAHSGLGSVLKRQGHLDQAAAAHREAMRLEPDNALFHYNLGLVLAHQGQLDAAIRCLREAVRLDPRDAGFQSNLGAFLSQRGHRKDAITALREAIRLDPTQARYHVNLGAAHTTGGHHDEAIAAFREAIRLDPDLRQARFNLGVALEEQGHIEEAVAAFRESRRLDPEHAPSREQLRLALRRLARRARRAFRQGDLVEAVALQERLLELMAGEDAGDYTLEIARKDLDRFREALDEDP